MMTHQDPPKQEYHIIIYAENHIGLLNRISLLFTRRKISIESLNTSPSEADGIYRFNIVISETKEVIGKLTRHLEKLTEVLKVCYHSDEEVIWQELAMYKIATGVVEEEEVSVERLLRRYGARAVVIRKDYTIFEVSGHREETDKLITVLEPYGLIEFVRSARVAIVKDNKGFNRRLREFEKKAPSEHDFPVNNSNEIITELSV
jgi:acetolactate synthase-1/3 small subunit